MRDTLIKIQTDSVLTTMNNGKIKVYLDDERETPEGWVRVYWPREAIELLKKGIVEEISLDHDLGDDERGTGYDVVLWIEEAVIIRNFEAPKIKLLEKRWNWVSKTLKNDG